MAKTIYTCIDGTYYKLDQSTNVPVALMQISDETNVLISNKMNGEVDANVNINNATSYPLIDNHTLYTKMVDYLTENKVTEIPILQDRYKMSIDYSLIDPSTGEEFTRLAAVDEVKANDKLLPCGVSNNNDLLYKRVKVFENMREFLMRERRHFGVNKIKNMNFIMKINDISIFQYKDGDADMDHPSISKISYLYNSDTINSVLENMVLVFSSHDEGIDIGRIQLNFLPRVIHTRFKVVLDNEIVAYSSSEITEIIRNNIADKNGEIEQPDVNDEPVDGITIDDKGISLTSKGYKVGTSLPLSEINEKLADNANTDGSSGIVTTTEF